MKKKETLLKVGETYRIPVREGDVILFLDYRLEGFSESGKNAFLNDGEGGGLTISVKKLERIVFPEVTEEIEKI